LVLIVVSVYKLNRSDVRIFPPSPIIHCLPPPNPPLTISISRRGPIFFLSCLFPAIFNFVPETFGQTRVLSFFSEAGAIELFPLRDMDSLVKLQPRRPPFFQFLRACGCESEYRWSLSPFHRLGCFLWLVLLWGGFLVVWGFLGVPKSQFHCSLAPLPEAFLTDNFNRSRDPFNPPPIMTPRNMPLQLFLVFARFLTTSPFLSLLFPPSLYRTLQSVPPAAIC